MYSEVASVGVAWEDVGAVFLSELEDTIELVAVGVVKSVTALKSSTFFTERNCD